MWYVVRDQVGSVILWHFFENEARVRVSFVKRNTYASFHKKIKCPKSIPNTFMVDFEGQQLKFGINYACGGWNQCLRIQITPCYLTQGWASGEGQWVYDKATLMLTEGTHHNWSQGIFGFLIWGWGWGWNGHSSLVGYWRCFRRWSLLSETGCIFLQFTGIGKILHRQAVDYHKLNQKTPLPVYHNLSICKSSSRLFLYLRVIRNLLVMVIYYYQLSFHRKMEAVRINQMKIIPSQLIQLKSITI